MNKTICIIEDDQYLVKAYQYVFEKENIPTVVAFDGQQAIKLLEKDPPALVLLDLMLPGVSGFDVLGAIKTSSLWKNVPVMIISNLDAPKDIEKGKELGAVEYLVKANYEISDIVTRAKQFLKQN